jgi:TPR repeat protein
VECQLFRGSWSHHRQLNWIFPSDATEAVKWYRKVVEAGSAWAAQHLGNAYRGDCGVSTDVTEARRFYEKVIEFGSTTAVVAFADLH